MKQILFRGKRKDNQEWVESASIQNNPFGGTYLLDSKDLMISPSDIESTYFHKATKEELIEKFKK